MKYQIISYPRYGGAYETDRNTGMKEEGKKSIYLITEGKLKKNEVTGDYETRIKEK